jgi:hypothetical protein
MRCDRRGPTGAYELVALRSRVAARLGFVATVSVLGAALHTASAATDQTPPAASNAASAPATPADRGSTMSSERAFPRRYEAIYHDDNASEHAGTLSMTADGRLAIVSAEPRFANTLDVAVRSMNAMPNETVRVPPPPGTPRYTLMSKVIPRESPEFIPTMIANLRRGYRLELRPADAP